jgi:hypothetical protein
VPLWASQNNHSHDHRQHAALNKHYCTTLVAAFGSVGYTHHHNTYDEWHSVSISLGQNPACITLGSSMTGQAVRPTTLPLEIDFFAKHNLLAVSHKDGFHHQQMVPGSLSMLLIAQQSS